MKSIVKKILSLAVCVAVLTGILNFGILADGKLTVSLAVQRRTNGDVELTVSLENNEGKTVKLDAEIKYDKSMLKLLNASALTGEDDTFNKKGADKLALTIESFEGNGKIATALFEVNENAQGEAKFTFEHLTANDGTTVTGIPASVNIDKKAETKIELSEKNTELTVGQEKTITATVTPEETELTWSSSDEDIATVDNSGKVTGVAKGNVEITAKAADGTESKCNVTVIEASNVPTGIEVDETLTITVGETKKPSVKLLPDGATGEIEYTSADETIATVSNDGAVTGVKKGEVKIIVKCGELEKFCMVTVNEKNVELTGIKLDFNTLTLESGERWNLKVSATPAGATIDGKPEWSSSNTKIATVSDEGRVRAKTGVNGTTVITVKYGGFEATCAVTVVHISATDLTLEKDSCELEIGDTTNIKATVSPTDSHDIPEYSSSDESVATVSSKGKVTAVGEGEATIIVKAGSLNKEFKVKVIKPEEDDRLESITLSNDNIELKAGEQLKLTYTTVPETIENFELTAKWLSGDDEIAEVAEDGTVTAKKEGMTVITLWLGTKNAKCTIRVIDDGEVTTVPTLPVTDVPETDTESDAQTQNVSEPSNGNGIFKVILVAIITLVVMFIALTVLYFVQKKRAADYEDDDDDDYYDDDDDDI